jgi:alpha-glucosidase (family GH31 glycosyl hydrolase)
MGNLKAIWDRRRILKQLATAAGMLLLPSRRLLARCFPSGSVDREIQISSISEYTLRLSMLPMKNGQPATIPSDGSLVRASWDAPLAALRGDWRYHTVEAGGIRVHATREPLTFVCESMKGKQIQRLTIDEQTGITSFETGNSPLLGMGEGGPQFDRRNSVDRMISGQGGYQLQTHGGRVPIPWLVGTEGWALFFHQPFGTFDLKGPRGRFEPTSADAALDVFLVAAEDPATIMAEYARLTGLPEMPPLWSFGYQQSHRTLTSREEVLAEANTFREKRLPCDVLIYLGTGFCPSGWNSENGSFAWNRRVFRDPKEMLAELHAQKFRIALHAVILADTLTGTVHDSCDLATFDETRAGCYWDAHRKDFAMGVDGWWPDEGDPLDIASRLTRNRMYWEGPQIDRPNERPYALHRNGYAGMQRYASFLWSGDVYSTWETLRNQVPIGINAGLSGMPYWGTDIGGFVPTREFTAELFLRWFQFGAFCTLFRSHGRAWKLRLPWGWNTGDPGPTEIRNYDGAAVPDASQLHNPEVERICRKYLELRYRMLPYLYSTVREGTLTGMPVMRALWLHFPDDRHCVERGDEYMWGSSVLVAPIVEAGAQVRRVYLPRGTWFDFWSESRTDGGREIERPVDLETIPLFVRAGAILPLGPVKQHTAENPDEQFSLRIYPGSDGVFLLYEDDGTSFGHRSGEWMGIRMNWSDTRRTLSVSLAEGSRMLAPARREMEVRLAGTGEVRRRVFEGKPVEFKF